MAYVCQVNRIDSNISFGGHPMYVIPAEPDYILLCKGVRGYLSQAKMWLKKSSPTGEYFFGARPVTLTHNGNVEVDCLNDTKETVQKIVDFCERHKQQYSSCQNETNDFKRP